MADFEHDEAEEVDIFTDEEEHNGEAISKNSFSIVKYTNREALKIIHFLKLMDFHCY